MAIPLSTLKKLLGPSVRTDRESCFAASYDSAKLSFLPEAVIFPKDEEAIGNVLALANQHRVPITTRGGGTAATGAASPVKGGWVKRRHCLDPNSKLVIIICDGLYSSSPHSG